MFLYYFFVFLYLLFLILITRIGRLRTSHKSTSSYSRTYYQFFSRTSDKFISYFYTYTDFLSCTGVSCSILSVWFSAGFVPMLLGFPAYTDCHSNHWTTHPIPKIESYNGSAGMIKAKVNMRPTLPP